MANLQRIQRPNVHVKHFGIMLVYVPQWSMAPSWWWLADQILPCNATSCIRVRLFNVQLHDVRSTTLWHRTLEWKKPSQDPMAPDGDWPSHLILSQNVEKFKFGGLHVDPHFPC